MNRKHARSAAHVLRRGWNALNHQGEDGQGLAEYALILGLVAAVAVTALTSLGVGIAGSDGFSLFS